MSYNPELKLQQYNSPDAVREQPIKSPIYNDTRLSGNPTTVIGILLYSFSLDSFFKTEPQHLISPDEVRAHVFLEPIHDIQSKSIEFSHLINKKYDDNNKKNEKIVDLFFKYFIQEKGTFGIH